MVGMAYRISFHIPNECVESHRHFIKHAPWGQIASLLQAVQPRVLARQAAVHGGRCCHCCFQHAQACAAADACCEQARVGAGMCQG